MTHTRSFWLWFYRRILRFYPRSFQEQYGEEMLAVFTQLLAQAGQRPNEGLAGVLLRELMDFPACLVREHRRARERKGIGMSTNRNNEQAGNGNGRLPSTWGEAFLAGLPYLLVLALVSASSVFGPAFQPLVIPLFAVLASCIVIVLIVAWRRDWPRWSASWLPFGAWASLAAISLILYQRDIDPGWQIVNFIYIVPLPLLVAWMLYRLVRQGDPLKGILAALPVTIILWISFLESVPDSIETAINASAVLILAASAVMITRLGSVKAGLALGTGALIASGLPYAYAGIYYGGALPFTAPGPSPLEVLKVFLPAVELISTLVLGPLLLWVLRGAARRNGADAIAGYRLVIIGLGLVILWNLAMIFRLSSRPGMILVEEILWLPISLLLLLGSAAFLGGSILVIATAWRQTNHLKETLLSASCLLLLGLPLLALIPLASLVHLFPILAPFRLPISQEILWMLGILCGLAWMGWASGVVLYSARNGFGKKPASISLLS